VKGLVGECEQALWFDLLVERSHEAAVDCFGSGPSQLLIDDGLNQGREWGELGAPKLDRPGGGDQAREHRVAGGEDGSRLAVSDPVAAVGTITHIEASYGVLSNAHAAASPPLVFESNVGTAGLIERIKLGHVCFGQGEVEDLGVLGDPLAVSRFCD
jgi:hypothetical protein